MTTSNSKWTIDGCVAAGLIYDMTSEEYHGLAGTNSSSQLKDALDDIEIFYRKYISKEIPREENTAFTVGTYFHTAVLEPEKLSGEVAVIPEGKVRRGKDWEDFQAANKGKLILSHAEMTMAESLVTATKNSPIAMNRIKRGKPEVSCFLRLGVYEGDIYALDHNLVLRKAGWDFRKIGPKVMKEAIVIVVKVRADLLADDFILDLKSTTGNAKSQGSMRVKISHYQYDLSAAFYLDIFSAKLGRTINNFLWSFASKDYKNAKTYRASPDNIYVGRAKWKKAILAIAEGIETGWEIEDSLGLLEPLPYEREILKERAEDLL